MTVGLTRRPRATAFRASRPAPTITVGLDVFVQEVIAAIATDPVRTDRRRRSPADLERRSTPLVGGSAAVGPPSPRAALAEVGAPSCRHPEAASGIGRPEVRRKVAAGTTRSWGRRGPATDGADRGEVERQRARRTSGPSPGSRQRPCAFA